MLVECQWRHQKSGALLVTGTQVYQIETESAPWFRAFGDFAVEVALVLWILFQCKHLGLKGHVTQHI